MVKRLFVTIAVVCCLSIGGCTEEQRAGVDKLANEANDVGDALQVLGGANGPLSPIVPPQVLQIMKLLGIGLGGAYAVWQKIRAESETKLARGLIASVDTLLASDQVHNTKKAKELLASDQGNKLAAKVKAIKES